MTFVAKQELYKVSASTGKMQVWKAWTEGEKVFCEWGELGGKQQQKVYSAEPKNVGRSNETDGKMQALSRIYKQCINLKLITNTTSILKLKLSKLQRFAVFLVRLPTTKTRYAKMSDTLLSSVKFNGSRACVVNGNLYSKIGRLEEVKVEHLKNAIESLGGQATFDSEVYAHGLSLQRIRSAWLKPVKTDKEIVKIAKDRLKNSGKGDPKKVKTFQDAIDVLGYNPNEDAL